MKHLEIHIIESTHDFDLANIAGLLNDDVALYDTICVLCEKLISSDGDARQTSLPVYVILNDEQCIVCCSSCLIDGVEKISI